MAWSHAQLLLYPLFWLLLFWGSIDAAKEMAVWAPPEVHGRLNQNVKLPCELQSPESCSLEVTQVTWTRWEPSGESSILAVLHRLSGSSFLEPDRMEFVSAQWSPKLWDASLLVRGLRTEDEANYTCEVTVAQSGSMSAATWLRVFYAPQVSIALYLDIKEKSSYMINLICDARSNPEPKSYDWSTTMGPLQPPAVPQGSRLLIQPTEESINMTFICRVSNDLGTGEAAIRVQLPGSPWEPSSSHWRNRFSLWASAIMSVAVLGVLVNCLCWR